LIEKYKHSMKITNDIREYMKFNLPNKETMTVYIDDWGHTYTVVTNKNDETVAVATSR
jgi:hypothetical protein